MAAIFYRDYLKEEPHKGHLLALDVRGSKVVNEVLLKEGGRGCFIPAGYPYHRKFAGLRIPVINKVPVGVSAETSGHFFFPTASKKRKKEVLSHGKHYLIDDGLYSALKFIFILDEYKNSEEKRTTIKELMNTIPHYPISSDLRLSVPEEEKFGIIQEIKEVVEKDYNGKLKPLKELRETEGIKIQFPDAGLVEVDGVRTQFKDESWFLVRASNTSPAITLRFEALTRSRLLELMKDVSSLLKKYPRIDISPLLRELEEEKKGVMANPGYEQESW